jgi:hypothetical protein
LDAAIDLTEPDFGAARLAFGSAKTLHVAVDLSIICRCLGRHILDLHEAIDLFKAGDEFAEPVKIAEYPCSAPSIFTSEAWIYSPETVTGLRSSLANCEEASGFPCSFSIHSAFDSPIGGPESLHIAPMKYCRRYAGSNG